MDADEDQPGNASLLFAQQTTGSMVAADDIINSMIEKIAHRAYLKELDNKIPTYTILSTTYLASKICESIEI